VANSGQKRDEKVTFEVLSVNHPEVDVIQIQCRKSAEKTFFKSPIRPQMYVNLYTQTHKTPQAGYEPV